MSITFCGYTITTPDGIGLLQRALSHSSTRSRDNRSLAWLGDAVLYMVMSERALDLFGMDHPVKELAGFRSSRVSRKQCATFAKFLKIDRLVKVGKSISSRNGCLPDSVLAEAFEAVLAVVYIDGGFRAAREFLRNALASKTKKRKRKKTINNNTEDSSGADDKDSRCRKSTGTLNLQSPGKRDCPANHQNREIRKGSTATEKARVQRSGTSRIANKKGRRSLKLLTTQVSKRKTIKKLDRGREKKMSKIRKSKVPKAGLAINLKETQGKWKKRKRNKRKR